MYDRTNAFNGAILNSALYLALVCAAGIAGDFHIVTACAISAAGMAFVSYASQILVAGTKIAIATSWLSWMLGICAGVDLLFKYWS